MNEFYRYTDSHDANDITYLDLSVYYLLRETPCGYWIFPRWANSDKTKEKYKKWVPKKSKKRFAYPTKKEAINNFKRRKEMQIWWAEYNIRRARSALSKVEFLEEYKPETLD
jgi:pyruvate/2-oxoacid:ferredoxin oxidoreductase beta subunit